MFWGKYLVKINNKNIFKIFKNNLKSKTFIYIYNTFI